MKLQAYMTMGLGSAISPRWERNRDRDFLQTRQYDILIQCIFVGSWFKQTNYKKSFWGPISDQG